MATVTTYHCLCAELVLASTTLLSTLTTRGGGDKALIFPLRRLENLESGSGTLTESVSVDSQAVVLKLEDGFEKRYLAKCARCGLMLGYQLDLSQFAETSAQVGARKDVLYLLPGGFMTTEEMIEGRKVVNG